MSQAVTSTPAVLFVVFNRPETTVQVFDAIRSARPPRLYIAADGPRAGRPAEAERCRQVLAITEQVDWPCQVQRLVRENNLGCGRAVSGAISWFFEHEEEGIILEDDCLPSPDFFRFCTEMLAYYRHDDRVMEIAGSNMLTGLQHTPKYSYFFSDHEHIWGWATWRRAWQHYDYKMNTYPLVLTKGYFNGYDKSFYEAEYIRQMYDKAHFENEKLTWWDYQWTFARRLHSGLVAVPVKSLIKNIGLGIEATNTSANAAGAKTELQPMAWPLQHPPFIMLDATTDNETFRHYFTTPASRVKSWIKRLLPVTAKAKPAVQKLRTWLARQSATWLPYMILQMSTEECSVLIWVGI